MIFFLRIHFFKFHFLNCSPNLINHILAAIFLIKKLPLNTKDEDCFCCLFICRVFCNSLDFLVMSDCTSWYLGFLVSAETAFIRSVIPITWQASLFLCCIYWTCFWRSDNAFIRCFTVVRFTGCVQILWLYVTNILSAIR